MDFQGGTEPWAKCQPCLTVQQSVMPSRLRPSERFEFVSIHSNHGRQFTCSRRQWTYCTMEPTSCSFEPPLTKDATTPSLSTKNMASESRNSSACSQTHARTAQASPGKIGWLVVLRHRWPRHSLTVSGLRFYGRVWLLPSLA